MKLSKVWAAAILAVFLSGCAALTSAPIPAPATPPDSLLQDCQHAARPADNTVYGLILGLVAERAVMESCDWADKAALRAWKIGVTASQPKPASGVTGK